MSVRTLFTSHARCWSVGSLPYLYIDAKLSLLRFCWFHGGAPRPATNSFCSVVRVLWVEAHVYDAVAHWQDCRHGLPHRALICDRVRFQPSQGTPRCDPKNLVGPMTVRLRLALDGHEPAQRCQRPRTSTLHPFVVTVNDLQRRLGGRCCTLGLNHRLGRCPKETGWLVRLPCGKVFVAAVACRCPFPLDAGWLACFYSKRSCQHPPGPKANC
jgi:hypothetical protein